MSKAPLRSRARLVGVVYLLYFVTAVSGGLLVKGLAVHGDAAATANNVTAHEVLVRASSAMGLVSLAMYLVLTAMFYELFRPVFLGMHVQALHIALVLFGGFDLLIGILIVRSGFLPRIFGLLMVFAGLGWLIYLWPPLADDLSRIVQPMGFLTEAILMGWLLAKGVNEEQWRALAGYMAVRS